MSTSRKGKRVAVVSLAVGLAVLGVAGYALRDGLMEWYWLYQLEHGDETENKLAAQRLGSMKSVRAIPLLAKRMCEAAPRSVSHKQSTWVLEIDLYHFEQDRLQAEAYEWATNWPGQALAAIGTPSVPAVLDAVRGEVSNTAYLADPFPLSASATVTYWCLQTLTHIGFEAIPALQAACDDKDQYVRELAAKTLDKVRERANGPPR